MRLTVPIQGTWLTDDEGDPNDPIRVADSPTLATLAFETVRLDKAAGTMVIEADVPRRPLVRLPDGAVVLDLDIPPALQAEELEIVGVESGPEYETRRTATLAAAVAEYGMPAAVGT